MRNKKKEYRLRKWVKVVIALLVVSVVSITVYKISKIEVKTTTHHTPVGDYTCRKGIIEVCTGSKRVMNYLG